MNVTLGPGIMSNIFDGIERPLKEDCEKKAELLSIVVVPLLLWMKKNYGDVTLKVQVGDTLKSGDVYAEVPETLSVLA